MDNQSKYCLDSSKRRCNEGLPVKKTWWRKSKLRKAISRAWSQSFKILFSLLRCKAHYSFLPCRRYNRSKRSINCQLRKRSIPSNSKTSQIAKEICFKSARANLCGIICYSCRNLSWTSANNIWKKIQYWRLWWFYKILLHEQVWKIVPWIQ